MTTKLRIAKQPDGRWHVFLTWTDVAMGPTMGYAVGKGWSTFDLARKSAINYLAIVKAVAETEVDDNKRSRRRRRGNVVGASH